LLSRFPLRGHGRARREVRTRTQRVRFSWPRGKGGRPRSVSEPDGARTSRRPVTWWTERRCRGMIRRSEADLPDVREAADLDGSMRPLRHRQGDQDSRSTPSTGCAPTTHTPAAAQLERPRCDRFWVSGARTRPLCLTSGFQAAASYSLMRPPRIGRRRILPSTGSGTGEVGRGGRSRSARCGRAVL